MIQAELFQDNQIYTVVLSIMLDSFPLMSLSICSTVKQNVDKINSLLTCLRCVHFHRMIVVFLSSHWIFIALHCVKHLRNKIYKIRSNHYSNIKIAGFLFLTCIYKQSGNSVDPDQLVS